MGWLGNKRSKARIPALGNRELSLLEILWQTGQLSAQQLLEQLQQRLNDDQQVSLHTLQSTLERLHRKHLVERVKSGRAYLYRASMAKNAIIGRLLHDIAQDISQGDMAPMISGFVEYLADQRPELSAQLNELFLDPATQAEENTPESDSKAGAGGSEHA